jgi:hypothetical protein
MLKDKAEYARDMAKNCIKNIFWGYIGIIALVASMGAWPWIGFQFYENTKTKNWYFEMNWCKQPEPKNHKQILMYICAMKSKPAFDLALDCLIG